MASGEKACHISMVSAFENIQHDEALTIGTVLPYHDFDKPQHNIMLLNNPWSVFLKIFQTGQMVYPVREIQNEKRVLQN